MQERHKQVAHKQQNVISSSTRTWEIQDAVENRFGVSWELICNFRIDVFLRYSIMIAETERSLHLLMKAPAQGHHLQEPFPAITGVIS